MSHRLRFAAEIVLYFIALSVGFPLAAIIPWTDVGEAIAGMWR